MYIFIHWFVYLFIYHSEIVANKHMSRYWQPLIQVLVLEGGKVVLKHVQLAVMYKGLMPQLLNPTTNHVKSNGNMEMSSANRVIWFVCYYTMNCTTNVQLLQLVIRPPKLFLVGETGEPNGNLWDIWRTCDLYNGL